ncbi:restriction endonuclease subunit S [Flavobacterium sp.]|uniref:restriction endonuclease subunit S n=1 Tax=Flavobacterium sp. TaxID=239 RepID=UPI0035B357BF
MMENRGWKVVKLGEVTTKIGSGSTPTGGSNAYKEEGISLIRSQNILDFSFSIDGLAFIDQEQAYKLRGVIVEENDVLFNITGDSVARACKVPNRILPARVNQHVAIIRSDQERLDNDFLLYLLQSKKEELLILSEIGATRNAITKVMLENLEIQLPPLPEQKAIASVLSSLDDKIDLLHQQNQTLEALAETLFRQWFIEEAKEDWEVLPLSEIAEVKNGKSFKSSDFTDNDFNSYEVVKMGHIERGGGLKLNPKKDFVSREMDVEKWILNKGDIIMAMTDMKDNVVILGVPAMIDKDDHYVLNQRVARIYLKDNSKLISNYLLYIQLNNKDFIAELQTKANSGVQVNLSTEAIKESEILIPPIELQKEFGNKIIDLYSKIEINREQIQTLTQLRDTLLPKLMSGEVRVKV